VKFAFIDAEKAKHSVAALCRVLQVSRQGYYAWCVRAPSARAQQDGQLETLIRCIHAGSRRTYGAPRVHDELRDHGIRVAKKRVARLMQRAQLVGRRRRRFVRTTDSRHDFRTAPNLLRRDFRPHAANRAWAADITYIPTRAGWLFLAVIIDLHSRRVVGWAIQNFLDRRLSLSALKMAVKMRRPSAGLIHHSDRGVQYACDDYRSALTAAGAVSSMSRKGDCWDNAVVESFFSTLKTELLHEQDFATHEQARTAIADYIESFYNCRRKHSTLGFVAPIEYELKSGLQ
jgi:transposase InsO family protein